MNILITICARGGSKGIPGKNIKLINGEPLIAYTLRIASQIQKKYSANIALSTDSPEIKSIAEILGVCTNYVRPEKLATDTAGKIDTINDVLLYEESINNIKYDYLLDLDVTSPMRTINDIDIAFNLLLQNKEAKNIFSVNQASRNPYFNMVEKNDQGYYSIVKKNMGENFFTRQTSPKVFELNASFYWYRRFFFEMGEKSAITDKSLIYEMPHICFDLDHEIDFLFMEYLFKNKKLDFDL